jgi:hypothetical protein
MLVLTLYLGMVSVAGAQSPMDSLRGLLKGKSPSPGGLSETRIANGLKEALQIGTANTVTRTGKTDGYFGNPLIKILLPEKFQSVEKGLRFAGYGAQVDEVVLSMNRAAEAAAPEAKRIFWDAITGMTFDDAQQILKGHDTAATDFFKDRSSSSLYDAFRPVVDNTLNTVGTVEKYNAMTDRVRQLPFVKSQFLDLNDYVTNKSLHGLFLILAEEEKRIRENPAARVTDLLKDVFGSQMQKK